MTHYFKFGTLILVTILLASCATPPPGGVQQTGNAAEDFYNNGQYQEAAAAFREQAATSAGTEQNILLMRAVIALVRADQLNPALSLLNSIAINDNDPYQSSIARLTRAHIALAERNADEVLAELAEPLPPGSPSVFLAEYHELRANAFSMQGDRIAAAEEYMLQGNYLNNEQALLQSQKNIWQSLSMLSERALQQLQPARAPDILSGWMELVRLSKKYQLSPALLKASIDHWQRRYTDHPVLATILDGLRNRKQEDVKLPDRIALLLPLSGRFANAAKAIRDGLIAAYYNQQNPHEVTVRIYDTHGNSEDISDIYEQAIADGAQFVIGPLNKQAIRNLAEQQELPVPTLALNYIDSDDSLPPQLYQYGLSPEEEAVQVAERTWLDGHVNAAVLVPTGPWGERVFEAFKQRWEEIGGRVVEQQSYNASKNDFSYPIRKLLNIDDSKRRYRKIRHVLQTSVKYTTYRRQDIDFIFIAAYPRQARQIRPQLKFFHASSVPVYAT